MLLWTPKLTTIFKRSIWIKQKPIRKLQIVGLFFYFVKKTETIVGGNSSVSVEATNDQLWID